MIIIVGLREKKTVSVSVKLDVLHNVMEVVALDLCLETVVISFVLLAVLVQSRQTVWLL